MAEAEGGERYIDIRSHGKGVIGRVYETKEGAEPVATFKGITRAHLLKEVRKKYPTKTDIAFKRRGVTYF